MKEQPHLCNLINLIDLIWYGCLLQKTLGILQNPHIKKDQAQE